MLSIQLCMGLVLLFGWILRINNAVNWVVREVKSYICTVLKTNYCIWQREVRILNQRPKAYECGHTGGNKVTRSSDKSTQWSRVSSLKQAQLHLT
jgi:hypothetical protein